MARKRSVAVDELTNQEHDDCDQNEALLDLSDLTSLEALDDLEKPESFLGMPVLDEPEAAEMARTKIEAAGRKRKAVVPPEKIKKGMSLFEYLSNCRPPLDKKIIDIAIAQMQVPQELKEDAAQEIAITWATFKPDTKKFKPGQIASYAHRIARHTALRLRRELGSSVRLPGSAFRKKKDGSTYVTPGLLSVPLQWEELESWMDAEDAADSSFNVQSVSSELRQVLDGVDLTVPTAEDEETENMNARLAIVNAKSDKLTAQQREILVLLIRGHSYEFIQNTLKLKRAALLNEIEDATARLYRN